MATNTACSPTALSDSSIFAIRCQAAADGDCDLSRLCSQALWGATHQARSAARRKLAVRS